jgi:membrane-bound lytic murein transglycosylase MltF
MKWPLRLTAVLLALSAPLSSVHAQTKAKAKDPDQYDEIFRKYTKRFFGPGFDWQYFKAQAMAESNLVPTAKSRVGARGLMQLMPSTYKEIKSARSEKMNAIDDPDSNIAAGILFDRDLYHRWKDHEVEDERMRFTFASYNAGPGTIIRAKKTASQEKLDTYRWKSMETIAPRVERWRYKETLGYITTIEKNYTVLKSQPPRSKLIKSDN